MYKMVDLIVKVGEYGFGWQFLIQQLDTTNTLVPKDLTGYTATLKIWDPTTKALQIDSVCSINSDPTTGLCIYEPQSTDFPRAQLFFGSIVLTQAGVQEETKTFTIEVEQAAP